MIHMAAASLRGTIIFSEAKIDAMLLRIPRPANEKPAPRLSKG